MYELTTLSHCIGPIKVRTMTCKSVGCLFKGRMYCHFAKWRCTIMLPRHCEARLCAGYASGNHRRHIHRLHAVLMAGLCAAISTKCGCRQLVYNCSATACISVGQLLYSYPKVSQLIYSFLYFFRLKNLDYAL